jgi:hypothetical protein
MKKLNYEVKFPARLLKYFLKKEVMLIKAILLIKINDSDLQAQLRRAESKVKVI